MLFMVCMFVWPTELCCTFRLIWCLEEECMKVMINNYKTLIQVRQTCFPFHCLDTHLKDTLNCKYIHVHFCALHCNSTVSCDCESKQQLGGVVCGVHL